MQLFAEFRQKMKRAVFPFPSLVCNVCRAVSVFFLLFSGLVFEEISASSAACAVCEFVAPIPSNYLQVRQDCSLTPL